MTLIPDWFTNNVSQVPQHQTMSVAGANIHYQIWPGPAPSQEQEHSLLFVHGHAAHAHWWDFIAPAFSQQFQVGALDLSGYGDSDHRSEYRASQFAAEIAAVAEVLGPQTTLVAHSFGGSMARIAAYLHPEKFQALILVDSVITDQRRESKQPDPIDPPRIRHYESLEIAKRRFRLRPPQPRPADFLLDYLATDSVKQTEQGYQFKLDPQVFEKMWPDAEAYPDAVTMLQQIEIPTAYIYGALSRFCPPEALPMLRELFPDWRLKRIESAHHHVFLDQPLAFIEQLKILLEELQSEG